MATQIATMSATKSSSSTERSGFVRKLFLLFLLGCAAALGIAILFRSGLAFPLVALIAVSDAALGLLAGLSTRLVLRKWNGFFRFVVSLANLLFSLNILGFFTGWKLGLGFVVASTINWFGLAQVGIGVLAIVLSMQVGRRSMPKAAPVLPDPAPAPEKRPGRKKPSRPALKMPQLKMPNLPKPDLRKLTRLPKLPSVSWPVTGPSKRNAAPKVQPAAKVKSPRKKVTASPAPTRIAAKPAKLVVSKPIRPKKKIRARGKPEIQFAKAEEENFCPYCLEPVLENDPRGMVECKVCHAKHHGDCWEITGACQVPHYNA